MNPLLDQQLRETRGVCSRDDVVCVIAEDRLREVIRLMAERKIGAVIVIDKSGRTTGIFTERDLLLKAADIETLGPDIPVGQVMTSGVVSVQSDATVVEVADLMLDCGFRHVIINDQHGRPDGIVSIRDLFRVFRRAAEGQIRS